MKKYIMPKLKALYINNEGILAASPDGNPSFEAHDKSVPLDRQLSKPNSFWDDMNVNSDKTPEE